MTRRWALRLTDCLLAGAATVLDQPGLLGAAVKDSAVFTPYLLTATGPINAARKPDSASPSSLDAEMVSTDTAATLPRLSSGV